MLHLIFIKEDNVTSNILVIVCTRELLADNGFSYVLVCERDMFLHAQGKHWDTL